MAFDTRHDSCNEPKITAQFNHRHQCASLIEGGGGVFALVVSVRHGANSLGSVSQRSRRVPRLHRLPHSICRIFRLERTDGEAHPRLARRAPDRSDPPLRESIVKSTPLHLFRLIGCRHSWLRMSSILFTAASPLS